MAVRTNLIVPVPAAEPAVGAYRERLDPTAAQGVPAHISVLVGFRELAAISPRDYEDLSSLFAAAPRTEFALTAVRRFAGDVLYLAPDPAEPFIRLTEALWRRWPDHPPYGGAFDDIVPHLTVAVGGERFDSIERELTPRLPIATRATEVWLIADDTPGWWTPQHRFALGPACGGGP
jgi:hypothetical protein